jgi:hypothetical protein
MIARPALLVASLLAATFALTATPSAEAGVCVHDLCPNLNPGACVLGQPPCYQRDLACTTNNGQATLCVPNPCAAPTRCFALP